MLPKKYWRVALEKGEKSKLGWSEIGSKTYADERFAWQHLDSLRKRGVRCALFESEPVIWRLVDSGEKSNDPELPFSD